MKWRLLLPTLLVTLALAIMSCGGQSEQDESTSSGAGLYTDNTLVVGGEIRAYDYYIPDGLGDQPRPLIFLLHGGGSSPDDLTGMSGYKAPYKIWMDLADKEKFILAYPEGTINPEGALGWNDCRGDASTNPTVDDVGFIAGLIDKLSSLYNIDASRIYASGTSNGGHMSLRLALELSNKIAAVAPVVAAMPASSSCSSPTQSVSVLFMNGTADPILPYLGGEVAPDIGGRGSVLSTQASLDYWITFNMVDAIPSVENLRDINIFDNSTVRRITYTNGIEGSTVVLYEVDGGGHVEPSIQEQYSAVLELILGKQNHDIEMASDIWNFFKTKTL